MVGMAIIKIIMAMLSLLTRDCLPNLLAEDNAPQERPVIRHPRHPHHSQPDSRV